MLLLLCNELFFKLLYVLEIFFVKFRYVKWKCKIIYSYIKADENDPNNIEIH